jgi:hypothetical protein
VFQPAILQLLYDKKRENATTRDQAGFFWKLFGKMRVKMWAIVKMPIATMKNATVGKEKRWSA